MLGAKRRNNVAQPFANLLFVIGFLCLVNPTEAESGSSGLEEDQATQLREKAISLGEQHQIDAATEAFSASRQLFEELAKDDPLNSRYSAEVARTLESMGNMFVTNEQFDRASDCYRQSCQVRQQLSAKDPSDASRIHELATSFAEMGRVDFLEKKYDEAFQLYEQAAQSLTQLTQIDPGNVEWPRELATNAYWVGESRTR